MSREELDRFDHERLKQLELRGIEAYRRLQKANVMTPEKVVAFISQLSPWNLETSGVSAINDLIEREKAKARAEGAVKALKQAKMLNNCERCWADDYNVACSCDYYAYQNDKINHLLTHYQDGGGSEL